jgi:hypothetical protein
VWDRVNIFVVGSCDGWNYIYVAKYCKLGTYKYDVETWLYRLRSKCGVKTDIRWCWVNTVRVFVLFVSIKLCTFQDPPYDEAKYVECLRVQHTICFKYEHKYLVNVRLWSQQKSCYHGTVTSYIYVRCNNWWLSCRNSVVQRIGDVPIIH